MTPNENGLLLELQALRAEVRNLQQQNQQAIATYEVTRIECASLKRQVKKQWGELDRFKRNDRWQMYITVGAGLAAAVSFVGSGIEPEHKDELIGIGVTAISLAIGAQKVQIAGRGSGQDFDDDDDDDELFASPTLEPSPYSRPPLNTYEQSPYRAAPPASRIGGDRPTQDTGF